MPCSLFLPRLMYLLSALAWCLLLWPNPTTVFLAGCLACLSMPLYRFLRRYSRRLRRKAERTTELYLRTHPGKAQLFLHTRLLALRKALLHSVPVLGSFLVIFTSITVPIALFMVLVAPQISTGYARLRELWMHNFQLPPEWTAYLDSLVDRFEKAPLLARLTEEAKTFLDTLSEYLTNFSTDTVVTLMNNGFNVLGGTMSVVWNFFLFLTLSLIFTIYAARIYVLTARIFHIKPIILHRFIVAIRQALRAILLGVIFVALIQGFLSAIGFALVGYSQFAFWGLLAALVAPIPVLGTALIWVPLSLQLWFSGNTMPAMGLIAWGVFVVSTADSILRPLFLQTGIKANYLVLILAILCGISAFGPIGIILGPVLLAFSIQAMEEGHLAYPRALHALAVSAPSGQKAGADDHARRS